MAQITIPGATAILPNDASRMVHVVAPGPDGTGASLWTITHADDFAFGLAGLLGNPQTLGHAFHITSDESITWRQAYEMAAAAFNVPYIPVEISSHTLAKAYPDWEGTLLGDKAISVVFDNSKIKRFVPGFTASIGFAEGMRRAAKRFRVTPSAVATRLLWMGLMSPSDYAGWKKDWAEWRKSHPEGPGFGIASPADKAVGRSGPYFTSLVLGALGAERISSVDASQYLDLGFNHVESLRKDWMNSPGIFAGAAIS
jgi:hypothetical protein